MLKDLFNEKEEKRDESPEETRKRAIIYLLLIFLGFFLLFIAGRSGSTKDKPKKDIKEEITITKETIISKLDNIKDNYGITIYKGIDNNEKKLEIKRYKELYTYYGNALNVDGCVVYKNYIYIPGNESFVLAKKNEVKNDIASYSYNFELLKNITNYCIFKDNNTCEVNISDYLKEYNNIYKTKYEITEDKKLTIIYEYSDKYINSIKYDASDIESVINNNASKIEYLITLDSLNDNNFDEEIKYFEEQIKKNN